MPARTASFLDPMLDATKPRHLRQVEHLPRLRLHDRPIRQIPPAALAAINRMRDRLIRILTALKMMTRMPGLTTRLAPRPASQAPLLTRRRLGIPIRRRRLGRVARVLIQPRLELRNHRIALHEPNLKLGDLRAEHLDQGIQLSSTRLKRRTRSLCIRACSQHARKIPRAPPRSCPPTPSPLRRTKPPGPEQLRWANAPIRSDRSSKATTEADTSCRRHPSPGVRSLRSQASVHSSSPTRAVAHAGDRNSTPGSELHGKRQCGRQGARQLELIGGAFMSDSTTSLTAPNSADRITPRGN